MFKNKTMDDKLMYCTFLILKKKIIASKYEIIGGKV